MNPNQQSIWGVDIGGSHITVETVNLNDLQIEETSVHFPLNSYERCTQVFQTLAKAFHEKLKKSTIPAVVGVAMPGPFDYENGVSHMHGVGGKFAHTFGVNFIDALKNRIPQFADTFITFRNDAHCFAVGASHLYQLGKGRTVCISLGTGFGSAFLDQGDLVEQHEGMPKRGAFYNEPFLESVADDYFSSRWFLKTFEKTTGTQIPSVKELSGQSHEPKVKSIFNRFGNNLAEFLSPHLKKFSCDTLVIGGNIAQAYHLFEDAFCQSLAQSHVNPKVIVCNNTEKATIIGAAKLAQKKYLAQQTKEAILRKTSQPLLPLVYHKTNKEYEVFPSFEISSEKINTGFDTLAKQLCLHKQIIIEGYSGVLWDIFKSNLNNALLKMGKNALWYDARSCLKPESEINHMLKEYLNGNDPVFGKKYNGVITDFFNPTLISKIKPDTNADLCIVYGNGASICDWNGPLVYLDIPKNEILYRMRAKTILNLGSSKPAENSQMYKRFYFVDWPVLNRHKQNLLSKMDIVVDAQRINDISWIEGNGLRRALDDMSNHALRSRPWFEAGVWGGQWMKQHLKGLEENEINYAWSFELITPENGIVLSDQGTMLEISFDFLLYFNSTKILGKAAKRFGTEFPIRFDFLDTFDGGNLSIQCHPRTEYIQKHFGENFTQDETYYILDCESHAKVYLGFQDQIEPSDFKRALQESQEKNQELSVNAFVQSFPAKKHDLFLIPNGTIHASGKGNLVLEISSTPYIFTFKMYDWLRLDLTGKPRPINIEHAFNNLYFERKGTLVEETLISKQKTVEETSDLKKISLSTHDEHFYAVERYEFSNSTSIFTNNQCHVCMLVEGETIEVITKNRSSIFHYAETFIVPANAEHYSVNNKGLNKAKLIVSFVKDEYC